MRISKTIGRVCLAVATFLFIGFGSTDKDVNAASKKLVSVSYEPVKKLTLKQGVDGNWISNTSSKIEDEFYYRISDLYSDYRDKREGDKIILQYGDNTTKELIAKLALVYLGDGDFECSIVFVNTENSIAKKNTTIRFIPKNYYNNYKNNLGEDSKSKTPEYVYTQSEIDNYDLILFDSINIEESICPAYTSGWEGGNEYDITMKIAGKKCKVPVYIKPHNIKKITLKTTKTPKIKAQTGGKWDINRFYDESHTRSDWNYYYRYDFTDTIYNSKTTLVITYSDNTKKEFYCPANPETHKYPVTVYLDGGLYNYDNLYDNSLDRYFTDGSSSSRLELDYFNNYKSLKVGKTYTFPVYYLDVKTTFKVKIVKDKSIKNIHFVSAEPITTKIPKKYFDAKKLLFKDGSKLIINYNDGTKKVFTAKTDKWSVTKKRYFITSDGEELDFNDLCCKTKDSRNWKVGKTYNATIKCMGKRTTVPIKVVS